MKKKGVFMSVLALMATLVTGVCVSVAQAQEQTEKAPFEASYALGETLKIPARTMTVNGETKECVSVVVYPDGTAVSSLPPGILNCRS